MTSRSIPQAARRSPRVLRKTLEIWEQLYKQTDSDRRALLDETLRVLKRILELGDLACVGAALHGLGHLRHPQGWKLVQAFIDAHHAEFEPEQIEWMRTCRESVAM